MEPLKFLKDYCNDKNLKDVQIRPIIKPLTGPFNLTNSQIFCGFGNFSGSVDFQNTHTNKLLTNNNVSTIYSGLNRIYRKSNCYYVSNGLFKINRFLNSGLSDTNFILNLSVANQLVSNAGNIDIFDDSSNLYILNNGILFKCDITGNNLLSTTVLPNLFVGGSAGQCVPFFDLNGNIILDDATGIFRRILKDSLTIDSAFNLSLLNSSNYFSLGTMNLLGLLDHNGVEIINQHIYMFDGSQSIHRLDANFNNLDVGYSTPSLASPWYIDVLGNSYFMNSNTLVVYDSNGVLRATLTPGSTPTNTYLPKGTGIKSTFLFTSDSSNIYFGAADENRVNGMYIYDLATLSLVYKGDFTGKIVDNAIMLQSCSSNYVFGFYSNTLPNYNCYYVNKSFSLSSPNIWVNDSLSLYPGTDNIILLTSMNYLNRNGFIIGYLADFHG
jgi:hypothetical protein